MSFPGDAHILGGVYRAASFGVVSHIQHQYARLQLYYLAFGGILLGSVVYVPGFTVVPGVHDACGRDAVRFRSLVLEGNH